MSDAPKPQHGTPSGAALGTTDGLAATGFYAGVFGWEAENTPSGPAGIYTLLRQGGKDVAALYEQNDAMKQRGVPPLWLVYIAVDDASATGQKGLDAGGTVPPQTFHGAEAGRMALVQDPAGAMFGLWQAGSRKGAEVLHEPGALDWFELATNDPEAAGAFYEQVLGWTVNAEEFDGTPYTTCLRGEEPVAGILPAEALPEGVPPNWSVYFAVEDCAATVEKAQQTGGELIFGPHEMPRVGRFAGLRDPQGAAFAVIQPTSPEDTSGDESEAGESGAGESDAGESDESSKPEGASEGQDKSEGKAKSGGDEPDDAVQDGEAETRGEPNEELKEQKKDRGQAQADGQSDDSEVR